MNDGWETVDILSSEGVAKIDGMEIPCTFIKSGPILRVMAAETCVIPGNSEYDISVLVERGDYSCEHPGEALIEPSMEFQEKHEILASRSLVDLGSQITGLMRILNPLNEEVTIMRNTIVGVAEKITDDTDVVNLIKPCDKVESGGNSLKSPLHSKETEIIRKVNREPVNGKRYELVHSDSDDSYDEPLPELISDTDSDDESDEDSEENEERVMNLH